MPLAASHRNRLRTLRAAVAVVAALASAACTPLGVFNTFVPTDPAVRGAVDQPYGPGKRQTLDVYAPRRIEAPRPMAVFFYGGSWETGRRQDYEWAARALVARGFVVILPDYRLYPSVRFPAFLEDGAHAVRWAVDHGPAYGGDPRRIVLLGHSAGAYNAVMLALDDSYLTAAGVDPNAIKAVAGLAGPYDFVPLREKGVLAIFGQSADLSRTQPATFARADAPPMFLATGDADAEVPPRDTTHLAKVLREAGATVEEHHYPGLDHNDVMKAIARPFRGMAPLLDEMTAFLIEKAG